LAIVTAPKRPPTFLRALFAASGLPPPSSKF
jgi:hypothetical protein